MVCVCVCVCVNCEGPRSDLDSVSGRPTHPSWTGAAAGAGSRLWLKETRLARGGLTVLPVSHIRESAHAALRQALMSVGAFQHQVGNLGAGEQ